jgi:hypothetical protein
VGQYRAKNDIFLQTQANLLLTYTIAHTHTFVRSFKKSDIGVAVCFMAGFLSTTKQQSNCSSIIKLIMTGAILGLTSY